MRDVIISNDGFSFIQRAAGLPEHFQWVNGLYPLGYPILLRIAFQIFGDYRMGGNLLSAFSAGLTLICIYKISLLFGLRRLEASLFVIMVALAATFRLAAKFIATDMFQLVCLMLGLWVLLSHSSKRFLGAGFLLGIGYLMRYTAGYFLIATMIWVLTQKEWLQSLILLGGFLLGSAPQWVISLLQTGNPLYTNAGFLLGVGLYLSQSPTETYYNAAQNLQFSQSLSQLVIQYPREIFSYFSSTLRAIIFDPAFWTAPYLYLLVLPAVAWAFLRSWEDINIRLLVLWWLVYACAVAIMLQIEERWLLPLVPLTYLFVFLMISYWHVARKAALVFLIGLIFLEARWFVLKRYSPPDRRSTASYVLTYQILSDLGAFHPQVQATVLDPSCGGDYFYDLNSPLKTPVGAIVLSAEERSSPQSFRSALLKSSYRYVIVEPCDLPSMPWMEFDLPAGLRWVADTNIFSVLRVEPLN